FTADLETRFLIVKMGADRLGNTSQLTNTVRPDISLVLTVGTAHAQSFGSLENIAITKGEIVEAPEPNGSAVLNADDSKVAEMAARVPSGAKTIWFSAASLPPERQHLLYAADAATTENENPRFNLQYLGDDATDEDRMGRDVTAHMIGEHHTSNMLAAAAAALAAGLDLETIAEVMPEIGPTSAHRMARTDRADGITIIDDAYNANPESMRAGLKTLAMLGRNTGRRTWAILGPMLELGDQHAKEHILLGETVVRLNIDQLVVVGTEARALYTGAVNEGSWGDEVDHVLSNDEAFELLTERAQPGDIIFVKGSNGTRLWELADRLTTEHLVGRKEMPSGIGLSIGAVLGVILTVVGTPLFIRLLNRRGYGQIIRDDGPTTHATKRGTPTMGGVVIVINFVLVYFVTHWIMSMLELENSGITVSALLLLFLTAGMGLIGFLDDYIKISNQRSLGLTPTGKIVGQGAVGITFAILALNFPNSQGFTPASTAISVFRDTSWDLAFFGATAGAILFVIWSNLITTATTNAVNLTDGLDGLATGAVAMVSVGYVLITLF